MVSKSDEISWNKIIKKEARGIDNADFGEIQSVDPDHVITQKGIIDKEIFFFPTNLVQGDDGDVVWFKVTEEEARNSYMQSQNVNFLDQGDSRSNNIETETTYDKSLSNTREEDEKIIPLMAEKLDIAKTEVEDEVIITKEPVKDTKTEQIPVMHEELTIEIRPVTNNQSSLLSSNNNYNTSYEDNEILKPVEYKTNIRIPLKREEVEVSRIPYVKEEIVVKKKTVPETRTVTEEIIAEKIEDPQV